MTDLYDIGDIDIDKWRDYPEFMLGPFWVGNFAPELSTKDYGSNEFHGRFHPAIPWVAMNRFTKPGDLVWDCFAGSGTTGDVAAELGRRAIMSDLHPFRDDILERDTSVWKPHGEVDLAIMHPPYMNIIDYESPMSDCEDILSFVGHFEDCLINVDIALKPRHVLVLVVGEVWANKELVPLAYELNPMIIGYGYRLIGRIVKDFGLQTIGGKATPPRSGNLWKYRLLKYGYFRNGIDTILFYQKLQR